METFAPPPLEAPKTNNNNGNYHAQPVFIRIAGTLCDELWLHQEGNRHMGPFDLRANRDNKRPRYRDSRNSKRANGW